MNQQTVQSSRSEKNKDFFQRKQLLKTKPLQITLLIAVVMCAQLSAKGYVAKKAGVAFRFDDNRTVKMWSSMIDIFDKYGFKAALAINSGYLRNKKSAEYLKKIQANGFEIMNHTPYHRYYTLPLPSKQAAQKYIGKPGIDHIRGNVICFKYIVPEKAPKARRTTNAAITKGGLIKFEKNKYLTFYIKPYNKKLYLISKKPNKDGYYQLLNLWREPVYDVKIGEKVTCVSCRQDLRLTPESFVIEGEVAHKQFAKWGIKQPVSWIHPGCGEPSVHVENIKKSYGDKFAYKSAAVYINVAEKIFNEYAPDDTRRFAMQWGNIKSERQTLQEMQKTIADGIACNRVIFDSSHLRGSKKLGSHAGYLRRMDSLLSWLKANKIPVKTQSQWAEILYMQTPDPKTNVFPSFDIDLDKNNRPDGVFPAEKTKLIVLKSGKKALESTVKGEILNVKKLGGLEKGENNLTLDFNAPKGTKIYVIFGFNKGKKKALTFTGNGKFQKVTQILDIPITASHAYVCVSTNSNKRIVIQNILMRK